MQADPAGFLVVVTKGDTAAAAAYLDAGVDVETTTRDGDSALANAVFNGHIEMAALLLERGADVNAANRQGGDTVLMWAVTTGSLTLTDLLLRHGANVNAENKNGYRALYRAAYKGYIEIVKLLLVSGAEAKVKTALAPPKTALDQARESGYLEIVDVLKSWEDLQGQERIKEEYPEAASNYVANKFVSGAVLSRRLSPQRPR